MELFSLELRGIGTTRPRRPIWAIPLTVLEYRLKMSVSNGPTVGSRSKFFTCFRRLFSMDLRGICTTHRRCPVGAIPPKGPEYRLGRSVSKDPTVGSRLNCFTSFWRLFSMELHGISTTRRWFTVQAIPLIGPEYRLKRSVSKDLTVGSLSNVFTCFRRLFFMEFVDLVLHVDDVRSGPFHRQDQSTGSKGLYLKIQPLDRTQIF